jgi:hypothetical protein
MAEAGMSEVPRAAVFDLEEETPPDHSLTRQEGEKLSATLSARRRDTKFSAVTAAGIE